MSKGLLQAPEVARVGPGGLFGKPRFPHRIDQCGCIVGIDVVEVIERLVGIRGDVVVAPKAGDEVRTNHAGEFVATTRRRDVVDRGVVHAVQLPVVEPDALGLGSQQAEHQTGDAADVWQ